MKRVFVDTNVFLRYFLRDQPAKALAFDRVLARAEEGEVELVTTEMVLAEIVWVLETSYKQTREFIGALIQAVLTHPGMTVLGGRLMEEALETYLNTKIDFIDGYILARMGEQGLDTIYSYDKKHLNKIPGVTRLEP